mgnify:CR=1 FL=1
MIGTTRGGLRLSRVADRALATAPRASRAVPSALVPRAAQQLQDGVARPTVRREVAWGEWFPAGLHMDARAPPRLASVSPPGASPSRHGDPFALLPLEWGLAIDSACAAPVASPAAPAAHDGSAPLELSSVKKKRRTKMNRHKLRKRRKRDRHDKRAGGG